ncbi:unnamed protein product [Closterium sp. NIES-53]
MLITLYFIVTRLPNSIRSIRDHFLSLDPTSLTVDLLEQHLLSAETGAVDVGAARGTPRPPFFEGCSPSPLAPFYASTAVANLFGAEEVGAVFASVKRSSSKGKGSKAGGGGSGSGGGGSGSSGGGRKGGGGGGGTGGWSGGSGGGSGGSGGSGDSGGSGTGGGGTGARHVGSEGGQRHQQQHRSETQLPQQLHLLRSRIAIFDLDFDAILSAMYALSVSAEGDCYRCVLLDPGIAAPAQALHTFTLDSGASRCQVDASCSYRLLSHQTLLWHNRLGHTSLPRLRGMHSCLLVSSLPKSLPPLPPSPAPPCLPCVKGRQRVAPHSSSFPPTTTPLQTLHMDMAVCGTVRCASAQPLAPCLLAGDFTFTALDGGGWHCDGVSVLPPHLASCPTVSGRHQLHEWLVWHARLRSGAPGAEGAGDVGAGGAGVTAGAGGPGGTAAAGPGGARTRGTGAAGSGGVGGAGAGDPAEPRAAGARGSCAGGAGAGGAGAGGAGVGGTGAAGSGAAGARAVDLGAGGPSGTVRPRPYFVPLLQQFLGDLSSTGLTPPLMCPSPDQSQPPL